MQEFKEVQPSAMQSRSLGEKLSSDHEYDLQHNFSYEDDSLDVRCSEIRRRLFQEASRRQRTVSYDTVRRS